LDNAELVNSTRQPNDSVIRGIQEHHILDWMGGNAGAIAASLYLAMKHGADEWLQIAVACGDEICDLAHWKDQMCCWSCAQATGTDFVGVPLGGMSHGATGFALALLELYRLTGRSRYLEVAKGALSYEESLFDAQRGNWLDARFAYREENDGPLTGSLAATSWCHGAAGIALGRLRAALIDDANSNSHNEWFEKALAQLEAALDGYLETEEYDSSLCHGILGLADVLLVAGRVKEREQLVRKSGHVAEVLASRYGKRVNWPCGSAGRVTNSSLMLGLSGIGLQLLRCSGFKIESILAVPFSDLT
jgi:lantibiotic biosynthesis protein